MGCTFYPLAINGIVVALGHPISIAPKQTKKRNSHQSHVEHIRTERQGSHIHHGSADLFNVKRRFRLDRPVRLGDTVGRAAAHCGRGVTYPPPQEISLRQGKEKEDSGSIPMSS